MSNYRPTAEDLAKAADAFAYDVDNLYLSGVRALAASYGDPASFNLYIAAFAAYFRNVYDFVFLDPKSDYNRAMHFAPDAAWIQQRDASRGGLVATRQYDDKANTEVLHNSKPRNDLSFSKRQWHVARILVDLAPLIATFIAALGDDQLPLARKVCTLRALIAYCPGAAELLEPMVPASGVVTCAESR